MILIEFSTEFIYSLAPEQKVSIFIIVYLKTTYVNIDLHNSGIFYEIISNTFIS
jgi:hypothetical protein